jgi:hypothetical protein
MPRKNDGSSANPIFAVPPIDYILSVAADQYAYDSNPQYIASYVADLGRRMTERMIEGPTTYQVKAIITSDTPRVDRFGFSTNVAFPAVCNSIGILAGHAANDIRANYANPVVTTISISGVSPRARAEQQANM